MTRVAPPLAAFLVLAGTVTALDQPPASGHRHRLIGVAAKAAMMYASVLHHESAPERTLDRDLARRNAEEIARLVRSQVAELLAFDREPEPNERMARLVAEMAALAGPARAEADSLLASLASRDWSAPEVRRRSQRLFHLELRLLRLHQSAEAMLGMKPPADPPEPEAESRSRP